MKKSEFIRVIHTPNVNVNQFLRNIGINPNNCLDLTEAIGDGWTDDKIWIALLDVQKRKIWQYKWNRTIPIALDLYDEDQILKVNVNDIKPNVLFSDMTKEEKEIIEGFDIEDFPMGKKSIKYVPKSKEEDYTSIIWAALFIIIIFLIIYVSTLN